MIQRLELQPFVRPFSTSETTTSPCGKNSSAKTKKVWLQQYRTVLLSPLEHWHIMHTFSTNNMRWRMVYSERNRYFIQYYRSRNPCSLRIKIVFPSTRISPSSVILAKMRDRVSELVPRRLASWPLGMSSTTRSRRCCSSIR